MLKLLIAPVTNDRGPRYMERALAAIHQANHHGAAVTFIYAASADGLGLYVRFDDPFEELVAGPIAANYPNCTLTTSEPFDGAPPGWTTLAAELELTPELFPILRHAQFEDMLNGTFADPINGILRAIKPDDSVQCRVEMRISRHAINGHHVVGGAEIPPLVRPRTDVNAFHRLQAVRGERQVVAHEDPLASAEADREALISGVPDSHGQADPARGVADPIR